MVNYGFAVTLLGRQVDRKSLVIIETVCFALHHTQLIYSIFIPFNKIIAHC